MPLPCGSCAFQSASSPARSRSRGSRTAPECGRHTVGTYTHRPSPLSLFCLFFQILFEQVQKPRSMIVGCPKLAQLTIQVDQHFENRGFDFYVFNEADSLARSSIMMRPIASRSYGMGARTEKRQTLTQGRSFVWTN